MFVDIPEKYCHFIIAHAVLRKWVLLTDPDDKMAGVKVCKALTGSLYPAGDIELSIDLAMVVV